jgi:hypothetical protein
MCFSTSSTVCSSGTHRILRLRDFKTGPFVKEYAPYGEDLTHVDYAHQFIGYAFHHWENNALAKIGNAKASCT